MSVTEIYLRAAERIGCAEQDYSCWAIEDEHRRRKRLVRLYREVFFPEGDDQGREFMWAIIEQAKTYEERRDWRMTMLCLMAACWRDFV